MDMNPMIVLCHIIFVANSLNVLLAWTALEHQFVVSYFG